MTQRLWTILTWLKANLVWSIPATMLLGLLFGAWTRPTFLKSLVLPLGYATQRLIVHRVGEARYRQDRFWPARFRNCSHHRPGLCHSNPNAGLVQ